MSEPVANMRTQKNIHGGMRDQNIFGKMRGRWDDDEAMRMARGNVQDCLERIRSMSDRELDEFIDLVNRKMNKKHCPARAIWIEKIGKLRNRETVEKAVE